MQIACKRCGRVVETEGVFSLHKCPQCQNIKFDREFFVPIEKQVIKNFKKAETSRFGEMLKSLYVFGSYAKNEPKCGDVDFLVTFDELKLNGFIRSETETLQSLVEKYPVSNLKSILKESFWDFRTCQEYPDCLTCFPDNCKLPSEDYDSDLHTYCLEKCRKRDKDPIPSCCFGECVFLAWGLSSQIIEELADTLKEGVMEFYDVRSGLKVKVLDLVMKSRIGGLKEEFEHREENFQLYRIDDKGSRSLVEWQSKTPVD